MSPRKGSHLSEDAKKKISIANKGTTHGFKKGHKINLGRHISEETKHKLMLINKGLKRSDETKQKLRQYRLGTHLSEETKEKLRLANKGENNAFFGKHHTEETKLKIIKALSGRHHTKETKLKMSLVHKGKKFSEEHKKNLSLACMGRKIYHTEKTKREMSLARKGRKLPPFTEEHKQKLKLHRANQIFPSKDTKIEVKIRSFLDSLKIEYYQHKYMNIEHAYQCDFFIPSKNLVIETDGDYWHKYPTGNEIDHIRTSELIAKGFKVLRLWEHEIKIMDLEQFKERL